MSAAGNKLLGSLPCSKKKSDPGLSFKVLLTTRVSNPQVLPSEAAYSYHGSFRDVFSGEETDAEESSAPK